MRPSSFGYFPPESVIGAYSEYFEVIKGGYGDINKKY